MDEIGYPGRQGLSYGQQAHLRRPVPHPTYHKTMSLLQITLPLVVTYFWRVHTIGPLAQLWRQAHTPGKLILSHILLASAYLWSTGAALATDAHTWRAHTHDPLVWLWRQIHASGESVLFISLVFTEWTYADAPACLA